MGGRGVSYSRAELETIVDTFEQLACQHYLKGEPLLKERIIEETLDELENYNRPSVGFMYQLLSPNGYVYDRLDRKYKKTVREAISFCDPKSFGLKSWRGAENYHLEPVPQGLTDEQIEEALNIVRYHAVEMPRETAIGKACKEFREKGIEIKETDIINLFDKRTREFKEIKDEEMKDFIHEVKVELDHLSERLTKKSI